MWSICKIISSMSKQKNQISWVYVVIERELLFTTYILHFIRSSSFLFFTSSSIIWYFPWTRSQHFWVKVKVFLPCFDLNQFTFISTNALVEMYERINEWKLCYLKQICWYSTVELNFNRRLTRMQFFTISLCTKLLKNQLVYYDTNKSLKTKLNLKE